MLRSVGRLCFGVAALLAIPFAIAHWHAIVVIGAFFVVLFALLVVVSGIRQALHEREAARGSFDSVKQRHAVESQLAALDTFAAERGVAPGRPRRARHGRWRDSPVIREHRR